MAADVFLQLEGTFREKIEVLAWEFSASRPGTMHRSDDGSTGKATFHDLSIQKYVDASTPKLWEHLSTGNVIAGGKLTVRGSGGAQLEYFTIELKNILISNISTGSDDYADGLTEHITLNFEEFKVSYTPQKDDETGDAAVEFGWNIAQNIQV